MIFSFTQNLEWHFQYVSEYQDRLAEKTELDGFVRIGQLNEFQESANDRALLVARDADGFCGIIAGISESEVKKLLSEFQLIHFEEIKKVGPTAVQGDKMWHIIEVIARRVV